MNALNYRHELKFVCSESALYHMENKIKHICKLDENAGAAGKYSIKSLYFDTPDDRCFEENLAGADNRKKYRIRIYNDAAEEIRLECKYSHHGLKAKEICLITREQCRAMMSEAPWTSLRGTLPSSRSPNPNSDSSQELLKRFLAEKSMELLTPKVIVEYVRTPYVFPAGNVRITFDRSIRSSPPRADFCAKTTVSRNILPPGMHILEVKYDQLLPAAILELLTGGQDLRRTSFSKYALCRQYAVY